MPKSSRGGRGGGDRGRGRGGGDRGRGRGRGGGRGGHFGPRGDEEGRPRSMSGNYCGEGERRGSNQPRGSRGGGSKVRGRGGISSGGSSDKRFNAKQAVGRKISEDKMENVKMASSVTSTAETSPAASPLGVEKASGGALHLQSSKKVKKRGKFKTAGEVGKEESFNDGSCVEDLKHKSPEVKKSVASKQSSNAASPSSNQSSPNQIKSQALFASQDVRFKQENSSKISSLKVPKHSNYVQNHAAITTPNAIVDRKVPEKSRLNIQM